MQTCRDVARRPAKRPRIRSNNEDEDLIGSLPDDCIAHVFAFLHGRRDRCSCSAVSKRWFRLQLANSFAALNRHLVHPRHKISRAFAGEVDATDLRLAAMVIGLNCDEVLTELSLTRSSSSTTTALVPNYRRLTDKGIGITTYVCNKLRSVILRNCVTIGNEAITSVATNCTLLEKLELENSSSVTDDSMVLIAARCSHLSSLSLAACPYISNLALHAIAKNSARLKSLAVTSCPLIDDLGFVSVLANRSELAILKIASMRIGIGVFRAIAYYGRPTQALHLEEVRGSTLQRYSVLSECFSNGSFRRSSGLQSVVIKSCAGLTEPGLIQLTRSTQMLERLHMESCDGVSYAGLMEIIANCSRTLRVLILVQCDFCNEHVRTLETRECPLLKSIKVERCCGIGESFLGWLGSASGESLEEINLLCMDSVTDRSMCNLMNYFIKGSNNVARVNLTGCRRVGDRTVWAVTKACGARLRALVLDDCERVTDRGARVIGVRCPNLVELGLGGTAVGDNGVWRIAEADLGELEEVSLARCVRITDCALLAVEAAVMPSLDRVNLVGCSKLTRSAKDLFRSLGYKIE